MNGAPDIKDSDLATIRWPKNFDSISQANLWLPAPLYAWQVAVLKDLMEGGSRIACVTPNESGKTSVVIALAGLSFMAAFPGGQVVSTSGVERQIREQLWPVLRASLSRFPAWSITEELKIRAPRIHGLPPATWQAFTTNDPNLAEGFHSRVYRDDDGKLVYAPLLMIIDEAKTLEDSSMIDAFKRCSPDMWLTISTPGEDAGPFYDMFHRNRNDPWKCHEVTWSDCPHLMTGRYKTEREAEIRKRGKDDPFVLSWIFGKFFRRGGRYVFDKMDQVDRAMSGNIKAIPGQRKAALDFSGGGDEQVFMMREGNQHLETEIFHLKDTDALAKEFIKLFRRHELLAEQIIGDNGGLGQAVMDNLGGKGWPGIRRYLSNSPARDKIQFVDRGSEDHFRVRGFIERGLIGLKQDPVLRDQMRLRQYTMRNNDNNRVRLEPKEQMRDDGRGSPDRLDTLVELYSDFDPDFPERGFVRSDRSRCGTAEDCFDRSEGETGAIFAHNRFEE